MKLGFSTVAFGSPDDLGAVDLSSAQCLELCAYGPGAMLGLRSFVATFPGPIGLHCPLPFEGWMPYFEISGPRPERQDEAFMLVESSLEAARFLGADYVVVHFPSVLRDDGCEELCDSAGARRQAVRAAARLLAAGAGAGVRILFENVGPNPWLSTGSDFRDLFLAVEEETGRRPEMCLDPGHVHSLGGEPVEDFTAAVAPWVASLHLYNTRLGADRVGWHEPVLPTQSPAEGWMDIPAILDVLDAPPEQIIFEHNHPDIRPTTEILAGIAWVQQLVEARWSGEKERRSR